MAELKMGPTRKKLIHDLSEEAHSRLKKWAQDTAMRCDAADIGVPDGVTIILSNLTAFLIEGYLSLNVDLQDFLTIMQNSYTKCKHSRKEQANVE